MFFSTIAKDIDNKIIPTTKTDKDYLNASVVNLFFLTPVNDPYSPQGPYSIHNNILKLSCSTSPLKKLINFSNSEGIFPDLLKFANVIPVFKKEDNLDYNNYRLTNISYLKYW